MVFVINDFNKHSNDTSVNRCWLMLHFWRNNSSSRNVNFFLLYSYYLIDLFTSDSVRGLDKTKKNVPI